jgi:hypothetical protein
MPCMYCFIFIIYANMIIFFNFWETWPYAYKQKHIFIFLKIYIFWIFDLKKNIQRKAGIFNIGSDLIV